MVNGSRLNAEAPSLRNSNPLRTAPLDSLHVPDVIARMALRDSNDPLAIIDYERHLCHRCNLIPPTRRWCHEMYGGRFAQSFGWYIHQTYLRLGIRPFDLQYLPDVCPKGFQRRIVELRQADEAYHRERQRVMKIVGTCLASDGRRLGWL